MFFYFFFIDPPPTEIYTLSLHDALPISDDARRRLRHGGRDHRDRPRRGDGGRDARPPSDRKSTRLNSSHVSISYAVFCLKKKKQHRSKRPMQRITNT